MFHLLNEFFLGTVDEYQTLYVEKKIFLSAFFLHAEVKKKKIHANIYK